MDKAIVLLSGGMDSATALYWAAERYHIAAVLNFNYGQRGAVHEFRCANMLLASLKAQCKVQSRTELESLLVVYPKIFSTLMVSGAPLKLEKLDRYGQPFTFVPGRNLIFISYATAVAYDLNARYIIGGWSGIDVSYPDCSRSFLESASIAAALAIGRSAYGYSSDSELEIKSPLSRLTKAETVTLGESLGVPWELTRSCYADDMEPCLACDSCILRVKAFIAAGVRDPLVDDDDVWLALADTYDGPNSNYGIEIHDIVLTDDDTYISAYITPEGNNEPTSE